MQGVPIVVVDDVDTKTSGIRLAMNHSEATVNKTRFFCQFHAVTVNEMQQETQEFPMTFSRYSFDYEYVTWRKGKLHMFEKGGDGKRDGGSFWLSQLLFYCPVPTEMQQHYRQAATSRSPSRRQHHYYLDLIPIRTPARSEFFLTPDDIGPDEDLFRSFRPEKAWGPSHILPDMVDSGRWANIPVCPRSDVPSSLLFRNEALPAAKPSDPAKALVKEEKPYKMVACTWTSASYTRRGDAVRVSDSAKRLLEWIVFHLMVGVEHVYVYDNSDIPANETSILQNVVQQFSSDQVTYHRWPAHVCNNNRPAHKDPGERSSQYAAEASCRERYTPLAEWMTFLDTDEYLVPMKKNEEGKYHWHNILDQAQDPVLQFLSSRGRPRVDLME